MKLFHKEAESLLLRETGGSFVSHPPLVADFEKRLIEEGAETEYKKVFICNIKTLH